MSREARFTVTDAEYTEIFDYVMRKKRWRKMGHFLRDAVFQAMERNPVGRHISERGAVLHQPQDGTK